MNAHDTTSQTAGKPHQLEGDRLTASSAEASVDVTLRRHTRPYVCTFIDVYYNTNIISTILNCILLLLLLLLL